MTERTSRVWSPFTQMKAALPVQQVRAGRGAMLELEDGRQILDCISSWWVTLHGHGQPEIAAAVAEQAKELEQVIAAGFTHRPAEELARRLVDALPAPLKWVFYSDDGSTAVEGRAQAGLSVLAQSGRARSNALSAFRGGLSRRHARGDVGGGNARFLRALLPTCSFRPTPCPFRPLGKAMGR